MIKNCKKCNKEFKKPINCSKKVWVGRLYCSKNGFINNSAEQIDSFCAVANET